MGKTARDAVDTARADIARTIQRAMRTVKHGIGNRTPEEIRAAFTSNQKEAPLWAHASVSLARTYMTVQGQASAPQAQNNLAVVVVSQAPSVEAWEREAVKFKAGRVLDALPASTAGGSSRPTPKEPAISSATASLKDRGQGK